MDMLKELREMKETIAHEIAEANQEIKKSGGDLNTGDIEMIDKLTHAMKSLVTTCAMLEAEDGYSGDYAPMGPYYSRDEYARRSRNGYSGNYGSYARNDGRYTRNGYSRTGEWGDQLRQMKNAVLTRLALLSRAAIAGGLSLETSYSLWEKYVQSTETAQSKGELANLLQTMQGDFASRVHALKHRRMSPEIETACEYIDQHLQEPLTIEKLASLDGYAEYYFSRKFKRETGMSPAEYIRYKRLQKAASLLVTTDQDVKQIGSSLLFCSHSFFSDCFHRQYGVTPSQYRQAAML
jgi:AraC-like DNA-binding protein